MKVVVEGGKCLVLRPKEFVAEGGEGRIYARAGVAYKIYTDPTRVLADDKVAALQAIDSDDVVVPERRLMDPNTGAMIGYTMRHIQGAWVLGQLFARSFCDRHGFDLAAARRLVDRMQTALAAIHRAHVLVVDLSDVNVLVAAGDRSPAFIDSDSWQTPGHPATAITPSTCDPLAATAGFSEGSDWFSFAVLSFQLLVGIHPFRGKHPTVRGLPARMAAGLSVLHADVSTPSSCRDLSVVPRQYRSWYEAIFSAGHRDPPPASMSGPMLFAVPALPTVAGGHALQIDPVGDATATIVQTVAGDPGTPLWLLTHAGVQRGPGGPLVHGPVPAGSTAALGLEPTTGTWLLAIVDPTTQRITLVGGRALVPTTLDMPVDDLAATPDGRIVARSGGNLIELTPFPLGEHRMRVVARVVGHVLPHATTLGSGVAIQDVLGRAHAHLLAAPGKTPQVRVPELDGHRVLDAKYERGVLVVTARPARTTSDLAVRVVVRYSPDFRTQLTTVTPDVEDPTVDFTVTDDGICVARTDRERLRVFVVRPDAVATDRVLDASPLGAASLARSGSGAVLAVAASSVSRLRLAPVAGPPRARPRSAAQ